MPHPLTIIIFSAVFISAALNVNLSLTRLYLGHYATNIVYNIMAQHGPLITSKGWAGSESKVTAPVKAR
jgi:hypothetical protein